MLIISGLFFCLILLEIGLRLSGFIFLSLQEYRNKESIQQKGGFRILCLGESTTALGGKYAYPNQLEEILNQHNTGIRFSVVNKGVPAIVSSDILANLEKYLSKYHPKIVITMVGINDSYIKQYKGIMNNNTVFLDKLRIYRLVKLVLMNIINKIKRGGIYKKIARGNTELEKFIQAEYLAREANELNPLGRWDYLKLILNHINSSRHFIVEDLFNRDIESGSISSLSYILLGAPFDFKGEKAQAVALFEKALKLDPQDMVASMILAGCYTDLGKFTQARGLIEKAIDRNPEEDKLYGALAICYEKKGEYGVAEEYYKKANELRLKLHNTMTINNFYKIKQILDRKGIQLVCVQYPMRSVESLKKIFAGQKGIIFVDNEKVFKKAVRREGYDKYFLNMFGGDFGHCTPKGNRLLAENIANVILKEYFNK